MFPDFSQPPILSSFWLCFSSTLLLAVMSISVLSLNPYCIIPYSPFSCSGFAAQQSHILRVSPSLASPSIRRQTLRHPTPPSFSFPFSLLSNLRSIPLPYFSLAGLFPQPEVNTLQHGIISSQVLWQYKNSEWTAQSLFHLRFDCNGIASCPWEAPAASPTRSLWH